MMIKSTDILADMHTHTIFSKHAYSTVLENLKVAERRGLKYMAVTDHYYNNGDELDKKNEINRICYIEERVNREDSKVRVIGSAEFNLNQGIFDREKLNKLVWRPIGLHNWFIDTKNLELSILYDLFEGTIYDGFTSFVHIERELHKVYEGKTTFEEQMKFLRSIVDLAKEKDIWLEVNESTLITAEKGSDKRLLEWVKYAKTRGNKIYLGTDAHYCEEVGDFKNVLELLNYVDYPKDLILNCDVEKIKEFCH